MLLLLSDFQAHYKLETRELELEFKLQLRDFINNAKTEKFKFKVIEKTENSESNFTIPSSRINVDTPRSTYNYMN